MLKYPQLNFPIYQLKISHRSGGAYVWDPSRGQWLVLTPEEWVRQHTIQFLYNELGAAPGCIAQEYEVQVSGNTTQRADIVVFTSNFEPIMVVECKAAEVPIDAGVLAQAVRYNSVIGARYIMLTNGLKHYFYERGHAGGYIPMQNVPDITVI